MKQSVYFCFACCSVVFGAAFAILKPSLYSIAASALIAGVIMIFSKRFAMLVCVSYIVCMAAWLYANHTLESTLHLSVPKTAIACSGTIDRIRNKIHTQHLTVSFHDSCSVKLKKVLLITSLYPEYALGERVHVNGELRKPEKLKYSDTYGFERSFAYDQWLAMQGIAAVMIYPDVSVLPGIAPRLSRYLFLFKQSITRLVLRAIPGSEGSLLNGILLGEQDRIDPHIANIFRRTGISHIVALSGFNITIIAVFFLRVAPCVHIGRRSAIAFTLVAIFLFTILTGASASIVRAAIMGSLTVMAYVVGRPQSVIPLVLFSAAGMTLAKPLIVLFDVGFQLSFLATLGLIVLYPSVDTLFKKIPNVFGIREVIGATLVALIVTTPLSMSTFGTASPVSLLANILVVPLIPWIMALGAVLVLLSKIPLLGTSIALLTWTGLKSIIYIVDALTRIPQSYVVFESVSWYISGSVYALLFALVLYLHRKSLKKVIQSL